MFLSGCALVYLGDKAVERKSDVIRVRVEDREQPRMWLSEARREDGGTERRKEIPHFLMHL